MLIPHLPACKCEPRTQCRYTGKEANASMAHEAEAGRGMAVQNEGLQRRGSHLCGQWERRASNKSAAAPAAQKVYWVCSERCRREGRGCSGAVSLQATAGLLSGYRWGLHGHKCVLTCDSGSRRLLARRARHSPHGRQPPGPRLLHTGGSHLDPVFLLQNWSQHTPFTPFSAPQRPPGSPPSAPCPTESCAAAGRGR